MTEGPAAAVAALHEAATCSLVFEAVGAPAPQGSKSFKGFRGGKPVLVESCRAVAPWRSVVVAAARSAVMRPAGA